MQLLTQALRNPAGRAVVEAGGLFTIEELFAGKAPKIPLMERGFKAAAREERNDQPDLDL